MSVSKNIKQSNYWERLEITPEDLQHLANYLFETEEPLTISELSKVLISYRQECIRKSEAARAAEAGKVYQPKNSYQLADKLRFPEFDDQIGIITDIRESNNPSMEAFKVAKVEFEDGSVREFAIELA